MTRKSSENIELKDVKAWTMVEVRPLSPVEEDQRETDPHCMEGVEEEFSPRYASGMSLAFIVLGLCLTVFVIHLDANIIATAIPRITSSFSSLDDVGWYGSVYLLTSTALQPCFGRLYASFDLKFIYLLSLLVFEAGSIVCATAKSSPMFIVGRAVAGLGVAALFSGSMSILAFSIPLEKRPLYIAVLASMYGISAVVGPVLGGVLTDRLSWRWCFWVNLPFGAFTFCTIAYFFQSPQRNRSSSVISFWGKCVQVDFLGAALFVGSTVCLFLALQSGGTVYAWKNARIWGLFIGSALIFAVFIFWQKIHGDNALIPLKLLTQRTVLAATASSLFYSMTMAIYTFYLPIYFQAVKHTSAEGSGIHILPLIISLTLAAGLVGLVVTITGEYVYFMWAGSVVTVIGCGMLSTLDVDSPLSHWLGYQLILGVGAGAGAQIPFVAVQVVVKPADTPVGLSLIMLANSLGGAVAISAAQSVFVNSLAKNLVRYAPGIDPGVITKSGITDLSSLGLSSTNMANIAEAFARALRTTFIPPIVFAGLCALSGLALEHRNIKGRSITYTID